jgi:hypothetical protein
LWAIVLAAARPAGGDQRSAAVRALDGGHVCGPESPDHESPPAPTRSPTRSPVRRPGVTTGTVESPCIVPVRRRRAKVRDSSKRHRRVGHRFTLLCSKFGPA